jgi:hypothetical protein
MSWRVVCDSFTCFTTIGSTVVFLDNASGSSFGDSRPRARTAEQRGCSMGERQCPMIKDATFLPGRRDSRPARLVDDKAA